jgi:hypothetical protein
MAIHALSGGAGPASLKTEQREYVRALVDKVWSTLGLSTISDLVHATRELGVDSVFSGLFPEKMPEGADMPAIPHFQRLTLASALKRMLNSLFFAPALPADAHEELKMRSSAEDRLRQQTAVQQRLHLQCDPTTIVIEAASSPKAPLSPSTRTQSPAASTSPPPSGPVRRLVITFSCDCQKCKGKLKTFVISNDQARGVASHYSTQLKAKRRRISYLGATLAEDDEDDEGEPEGEGEDEGEELANAKQPAGQPFQ